MTHLNSTWTLAVAATAAVALSAAQPLHAEQLEKTMKVGGTTVHYKVVLPNGYDPATAYPAILALGGGPQTMNTVDSVLSRNFRSEAEKRGYIVVAPAAPNGELFFEDGARIFPDFLKMVLADYKIQDNKFSHRRGQPAVLPVRHGVPGIHVGAQRRQASGHFQDVCVHVRGRTGRVHVARRDEERSRVSSRQGDSGALYRREGSAAPDGDTRWSRRRAFVRWV